MTSTSPQIITADNIDDYAAQAQQSVMPLEVASERPSFTGRMRHARREDVHCYDILASAHVVRRTPALIDRTTTGDFYKVSMMVSGSSLVLQDGREAVLRAGDLALYDTTRPYTLVSDDGARTAVVMIPRTMVDLPTRVVEQVTAVRVDGQAGMGGIISPLIDSLAGDLGQLATPAGGRLARNVVDLLTTMLVGELGIDRLSDPRHSLLGSVYAYIDDHLGDPELSTTAIAAAHYISPRYLQALFQREGTTVSTYIRERRLERCRRELTDPVAADRPVAAVAARWGFLEPTHFSRVFREQFGCSPREARAAACEVASFA